MKKENETTATAKRHLGIADGAENTELWKSLQNSAYQQTGDAPRVILSTAIRADLRPQQNVDGNLGVVCD